MIKTAVIILNWNGIGFLKMFLPGVVKHSSSGDTKIYIADNGSTDGSAEWIDENFSEVTLIRLESNYGFSAGYNLAIQQVEAQYYVLLNSDIEVEAGWLEPLISCLDADPAVASCQPKILSYKRKDHFEYAGAAGGFIDKYGYPLCRGRVITEIEKDTGQYDTPADIFWSTGACMAVRSDAWKKCGGFDPAFFAHMEEIDLCWRFHRAGYRVRFVPGSVVYHIGGGALPYSSPFKTFLNFRNSLFLLYKNLPARNFIRTMAIRLVLDGVAAIFFLCKGQFKSVISVWKAHMGFYRRLKKLPAEREKVKTLGCNEPSELILNKCIVFEFYIRGRKTYKSLVKNISSK